MKEIRLGTIGSGSIVHHILNNARLAGNITLTAVYSRSGERGRALAEEYGCGRVYTDLETFLADGEVNTVYIASPNSLHYPQAKAALLAGKHVICEKPLCPRYEEAAELFRLADEKSLLLTEAMTVTYLPNFSVLRDALPGLGRVTRVSACYRQLSSRYHRLTAGELTNIFDPAFAGGCLMDINYYNLFLTLALFGAPEEVRYTPNLYAGRYDVSGVAELRYGGFTAVCDGAKDADGDNEYRVEGEKGYLSVPGGSNGLREVRIVTENGEETVNLQPEPDRYYYELQALSRIFGEEDREALRERERVTLEAVRTLEKARKAAGLYFPGD